MKNDFLNLLIDADMYAFRITSASKEEIMWDEHTVSAYLDVDKAKFSFVSALMNLDLEVREAFKIPKNVPSQLWLCFTDPNDNFRKHLLPSYKENRSGKGKPLGYWPLVDWMKRKFPHVICKQGLEADDCMGILATTLPNTVMCSGDKDFKSVPGRFFDIIHQEPYTITEDEADYFHLYQTLIGDTADNYKGCPGIGPVTAHRILSSNPTWEAVRDTFALKGLSEEDALLQARVARILRATDVDNNYQPILWKPKQN